MVIRYLQPRRFIAAAWLMLTAMLLLISMLGPALPLHAQAGITSPTNGAAVSGDVVVMGSALIDPFQKYELHYKLEPSGNDAYIYFAGATTPVNNGQLGVWQAGGLPAGTYSLRLRVVKVDGNYAEYFTTDIAVNGAAAGAATPSAETETPTVAPTSSEPTPTPIPSATFTPAPQPTVAVGQVAQPGQENATPTPVVAAVASVPITGVNNTQPLTTTLAAATNAGSSGSGGSVTRELGEALSINRLRGQFFNGMRISAALFLGVIAIYGGKRLFDWVWTQFS